MTTGRTAGSYLASSSAWSLYCLACCSVALRYSVGDLSSWPPRSSSFPCPCRRRGLIPTFRSIGCRTPARRGTPRLFSALPLPHDRRGRVGASCATGRGEHLATPWCRCRYPRAPHQRRRRPHTLGASSCPPVGSFLCPWGRLRRLRRFLGLPPHLLCLDTTLELRLGHLGPAAQRGDRQGVRGERLIFRRQRGILRGQLPLVNLAHLGEHRP